MARTILFTGDSVTDCGRRDDPAGLGDGYVRTIAASLPDDTVINTGISGNRVRDLKARWQEDVLDHKPDVVSVLIGVNDTWRRYDEDDPTSAEAFEADLRFLLEVTVAAGRTLVLMEPFLLPVTAAQLDWRTDDLDAKIAVVRSLATEFGATLVATDSALTAQSAAAGAESLAADGVHPTARGHEAIAALWLESYLATV
ncbi:MAG: hydrolase family protein [Rhodoglobus sp.]|nr:hydrolase family protein [Rhodoglobus sp.]